ncbi:MAG: sodium:solute symporter [bacterium]|nr:sodium:solute symporter [Deltaproteobacteria bacterium]MCP4903985.1 sodium:solute symporter [bacterium]
MKLHPIDWICVAVYLGGMALMGLYFARRNKDTEEYFVGGRRIPGWAIGLSMVGTAISSITFLTLPADSFKTYWLRFLPYAFMPAAAMIAAWLFIPFFRRGRAMTAYEYLEARFGPSIRAYGAATYIAAQLLRVSFILYLVALMLSSLTGVDETLCILVAGVFVATYTIVGGIDAVIWTDVIQTIVLIAGGLLVLATIVILLPGGFNQIFEIAQTHDKFALGDLVDGELVRADWSIDFSRKTIPLMLLMSFNFFLTDYATGQHYVQRYCSAASLQEARRAMWTNVLVGVPTWFFYMFLGTALFAFFQVFPEPEVVAMLDGRTKPEGIMPFFVLNYLPHGIAGLVIAAALAAGMSSLDSSINAISTVWIVDVYQRHFVKDADDRHYLHVAWIAAGLASCAMLGGAVWMLEAEGETLQDISIRLTALLGGGLLGIYLIGFFTQLGDARAIWCGIGVTVAYTLWAMGKLPLPFVLPFDPYYVAIFGNFVLFLVGFTAGLVFKRRQPLSPGLSMWG